MADEKKKISISIPADLLKEITDLGKVAPPGTGAAEATIVLEASAEQGQKLTKLREESEAGQLLEAGEWQTTTDRFIKVSELRISFYERLILLAGGSFALSLTYLGSLQRHLDQNAARSSLSAIGLLKTSWILLFICILLSWLHNLLRCSAVDFLSALVSNNVSVRRRAWESNLLRRVAMHFKGMESGSVGFGDLFQSVARTIGTSGKKQQEASQEHEKRLK
jgi:hypothetical protein